MTSGLRRVGDCSGRKGASYGHPLGEVRGSSPRVFRPEPFWSHGGILEASSAMLGCQVSSVTFTWYKAMSPTGSVETIDDTHVRHMLYIYPTRAART